MGKNKFDFDEADNLNGMGLCYICPCPTCGDKEASLYVYFDEDGYRQIIECNTDGDCYDMINDYGWDDPRGKFFGRKVVLERAWMNFVRNRGDKKLAKRALKVINGGGKK